MTLLDVIIERIRLYGFRQFLQDLLCSARNLCAQFSSEPRQLRLF